MTCLQNFHFSARTSTVIAEKKNWRLAKFRSNIICISCVVKEFTIDVMNNCLINGGHKIQLVKLSQHIFGETVAVCNREGKTIVDKQIMSDIFDTNISKHIQFLQQLFFFYLDCFLMAGDCVSQVSKNSCSQYRRSIDTKQVCCSLHLS